MFLEANTDLYGRNEHFTSSDFRAILDALDAYFKVPYVIREIRRDDLQDPTGRVDIEVEYINSGNLPIRQKLLIMDGELLDGKAFHARRKRKGSENAEHCVACDEIIPEGRQVCPNCEKGKRNDQIRLDAY